MRTPKSASIFSSRPHHFSNHSWGTLTEVKSECDSRSKRRSTIARAYLDASAVPESPLNLRMCVPDVCCRISKKAPVISTIRSIFRLNSSAASGGTWKTPASPVALTAEEAGTRASSCSSGSSSSCISPSWAQKSMASSSACSSSGFFVSSSCAASFTISSSGRSNMAKAAAMPSSSSSGSGALVAGSGSLATSGAFVSSLPSFLSFFSFFSFFSFLSFLSFFSLSASAASGSHKRFSEELALLSFGASDV
mmetsp:Transcript_87651/g.160711  ORF Transcript_87651/g.160711 Transcript_87651/m.160711 type:complete len:251 (+) Transcript_87651:1714-2466(+)